MNPDRRVINLPHRTDRLQAFHRQWGEMCVAPGNTTRPPAYGCLLAHQAVWADLQVDTLVLEDDAELLVDELSIPNPPADWDLLYLGGQHLQPPTPAGPGLVRCTATLRTHAYVIRHSSRSRLLQQIKHVPIGTHISHALSAAIEDGLITAYAVTPWQVGQAASFSDIANAPVPGWSWPRWSR